MLGEDLPPKVNFGGQIYTMKELAMQRFGGECSQQRQVQGPEAGHSGKASREAWWNRGCVNWVLRNERASHSQRKGEALARSWGPEKCMVGGSAAFMVPAAGRQGQG